MKLDAVPYIPHQQPMVFVDHLIEVTETSAVAELLIRPELMFCDQHGLPTWSSIELMAQTVSAFSGYQGQLQGGNPKIGFLLGTRKLKLPLPYFALGDIVQIRVEQGYIHEGLGQFSCQINYKDYQITAALSVYEPTVAPQD